VRITSETTLFAFVERNCSSIRRNAYDITMVRADPDFLTQRRPKACTNFPPSGQERRPHVGRHENLREGAAPRRVRIRN
jgi:hypothetical protein